MTPFHRPQVFPTTGNQHPLPVDTFQLSTRAPTIQSRQDTNETRNSWAVPLSFYFSAPHLELQLSFTPTEASQHGPPANNDSRR